MQFIDEVVIYVRSGDGGDGSRAFRREAHVPMGGPAGGDGGAGGHVILEAHSNLTTLLDLRYQREYKAKRGGHGQGKQCTGRGADPRIVRVPCGTMVHDRDSDEVLADLVRPGEQYIAAQGGKGGYGNMHFVSSTNRAPQRADPGTPGEERHLRLRLKLLADVGLVGLPNAGKSSLISRTSKARPKVADYPFTTLVPQLGVVGMHGERSFVMADIPGLIQGAAQGAGLGHRFLRHVERTRVLVFIVDDRHQLEGQDGSPLEDLRLLQEELRAYHPDLARKPFVVALNKIDLLSSDRVEQLRQSLADAAPQCHPVSAATGQGLQPLLEAVWHCLAQCRNKRRKSSADEEGKCS